MIKNVFQRPFNTFSCFLSLFKKFCYQKIQNLGFTKYKILALQNSKNLGLVIPKKTHLGFVKNNIQDLVSAKFHVGFGQNNIQDLVGAIFRIWKQHLGFGKNNIQDLLTIFRIWQEQHLGFGTNIQDLALLYV